FLHLADVDGIFFTAKIEGEELAGLGGFAGIKTLLQQIERHVFSLMPARQCALRRRAWRGAGDVPADNSAWEKTAELGAVGVADARWLAQRLMLPGEQRTKG